MRKKELEINVNKPDGFVRKMLSLVRLELGLSSDILNLCPKAISNRIPTSIIR